MSKEDHTAAGSHLTHRGEPLLSLRMDVGGLLLRLREAEGILSKLKSVELHRSCRDGTEVRPTNDDISSASTAALNHHDEDLQAERRGIFHSGDGSLPFGAKVAPLDDDIDDFTLRVGEGCKYHQSQMRPYEDIQEDPHPHRHHQRETCVGRTGKRSAGGDDDHLAELPDSVYAWACGEKLRPEDDDVTASEIIIGWLTLVAQVVSYVVLIRYAGPYEGAHYSIYSVFLAMFLMVSTSASDIKAGYMLLFRGSSHARRIFGGLLLISVALLVVASLRVLFMEAENNAELVIGATIVLFIEDVDNKLMLFMAGIPREWRLFWMLEAIGVSFWLSLVGIQFIGESEAISPFFVQTGLDVEDVIPWYFVMVYTPGAVTMWSLVANFLVVKASQAYRITAGVLETPESSHSVARRVVRMLVRISRIEPSFTIAVAVWLVFGLTLSSTLARTMWVPSPEEKVDIRSVSPGIIYAILGSAAVSLLCFLAGLSGAILESLRGTVSARPRPRWYPLFVGWGIGSFVGASFNYCTLAGSGCPPNLAWGYSIVGFTSGILMFAEVDLLGTRLGRCMRRPVEILRQGDGFVHWSLVCSLQFIMVWWVARVKSEAWLDVFFVNH